MTMNTCYPRAVYHLAVQRAWIWAGVVALNLGGAMAAPPTATSPTGPVLAPIVTTLRVVAQASVPDLQCASVPRAATSATAVEQDPREIPDDEEVQAALKEATANPSAPFSGAPPLAGALGRARPGEPYRVAIWGDSHLAAGFFTQELTKILKLAPEQVRAGFLPASMNRPGVRLPLRKSCVSPQWRYESAHAHAVSAAAPGPGLVNLFSTQAGATMGWDLRNAASLAEARQVRLLYQQTAQPVQVAVSVDGAPEVEVVLSGPPGPGVLELVADNPLSVVQLRLVAGEFRLQGLALPVPSQTAVQMDVFGFPGATAAGFKAAGTDYLSAWFAQTPYQLVMMQFGTNEGNAKPFDAAAYQATLREAVQSLHQVFPQAACVLIAPGDRGVLVRRSEKVKRALSNARFAAEKKAGKSAAHSAASGKSKSKSKGKGKEKDSARGRSLVESAPTQNPAPAGLESGQSPPARNLLQYTRIHEEIGQIQTAVAQHYGCSVWSMLQAMGGQGGAYRWARQTPPLMARDLIHFTVPGYQFLAQQFAQDMGWDAKALGWVTPP